MSLPSDPNSIAACSTGFAGWDASGNQIVLTAGHCAVEADGETQTGILDMEKPSIAEAAGGEGFKQAGVGAPGTWGFHQYGSEITTDGRVVDENKAIDFAVVNVADGFTNKAEVTDWTTASSDDLSKSTTKITEVGSETPGAAIQKSGRTTGVTEGTVVNDPEAFEYANIGGRAVHGFEVTDGETRFSDHGDSGGAVYQGDTAVGVISGGPEAGGWSWVADLDNSLEKSGKTITFEDPNEEPPGDDDANADAGADAKDAEADADGNDSDAGAAADAKNAESNADSDGSKDGEAPEERKLSIEPKEVSASDFVKQDKGVQIMAAGFEEGEKVSLEVVAGPENVEGITLDETANADGVAAFSIYGTSASDPSVYLGKYNVEVTGANDTEDESALTGSFEVVADEDGNGGGGNDDGDNGNNDDDGNGDGGSDLPRTGAELTGLAAGAGLLVVGGAAVVLTMRRKKNN
nr:LPXTG cell wall anchor domain-containing protein [Brevibacterium aurantiacum]